MKIVLSYCDSDGYTYSCDVHKCFEYESCEAMLVHLEEIVNAYIAALNEYHKKYDEHKAVVDGIFKKLKNLPRRHPDCEKLAEQLRQANLEFPRRPDYYFTFEGVELYYSHFMSESDGNCKFCSPEIRTLDEWFDYMRKEK